MTCFPFHKITFNLFFSASGTTVQNGTLLFTDGTALQCITVLLTSLTTDEDSCLSLNLSVTSHISGLTLSPSLATICTVPTEGESIQGKYMAITYILIDVPVLIGLQQGYYSILESSNLVQVCVEVISGVIGGRNIFIDYTTLNGSAEGNSG